MKNAPEFIDTYLSLKPVTNTDEFGNLLHPEEKPIKNSWTVSENDRTKWWQGSGRRINGPESPQADPNAQDMMNILGVRGNLR